MRQAKKNGQGFTLIAALIILVLLSGVAAGLMFMVSNEARMGGNDLENNLASGVFAPGRIAELRELRILTLGLDDLSPGVVV